MPEELQCVQPLLVGQMQTIQKERQDKVPQKSSEEDGLGWWASLEGLSPLAGRGVSLCWCKVTGGGCRTAVVVVGGRGRGARWRVRRKCASTPAPGGVLSSRAALTLPFAIISISRCCRPASFLCPPPRKSPQCGLSMWTGSGAPCWPHRSGSRRTE